LDVKEREDQERFLKEYRARFGPNLDEYERNPLYKHTIRNFLNDWLGMCHLLEEQVGFEKAKALIKEQRKKVGTAVGKRYKELMKEKGLTNPLLALHEGYGKDWAINESVVWYEFFPNAINPKKIVLRMRCHVGDVWMGSGDPKDIEYGTLLCDTDYYIAPAIDPRITMKRPCTSFLGDKYCIWVWELKE